MEKSWCSDDMRSPGNSVRRRQLNKKMAKHVNKYFTKGDIGLTHKHMKKWPRPIVIRDMQNKTIFGEVYVFPRTTRFWLKT